MIISSITKSGPPYAARSTIKEAEAKRAEPSKHTDKVVAPAPFERNQKLADQFLEHVSATPPKSTKDLDQIFLKAHGDHHRLQTSAYDGTHTCCDLGFTYSALRERIDEAETDRDFLVKLPDSPYASMVGSFPIPILGVRGSIRSCARELLQETRQSDEIFQKKYEECVAAYGPEMRDSAERRVERHPAIIKLAETMRKDRKYSEIFQKKHQEYLVSDRQRAKASVENWLDRHPKMIELAEKLKSSKSYTTLIFDKYQELVKKSGHKKALHSAHEHANSKCLHDVRSSTPYQELFQKKYEEVLPELAAQSASRYVDTQIHRDLRTHELFGELYQQEYEGLAFERASYATAPLLAMNDMARESTPPKLKLAYAKAVPATVADIADQTLMDEIEKMIPELNAIDVRRQARASKDPAAAAASFPPTATKTTTPAVSKA